MRTQVLRHLSVIPEPLEDAKPTELSWRDYLIMLLSIGAEIEHGLMVEYLYAAYSLGGDGVPEERRAEVQGWRDAILSVAREEMGHLLCVQNLLILLGGPLNFEREDYPWDTPYYPFPFRLEPATLDSIACYVYAEMPLEIPKADDAAKRYLEFEREDKAKVLEIVRSRCTGPDQPHRVGEIYGAILDLISDESRIPDSCFDASTYEFQASWDDWGRRYGAPLRRLDAEGSLEDPAKDPERSRKDAEQRKVGCHVIVARAATRTEAIRLLQAVSGQGEAPHLGSAEMTELSHFDRFLEVYQGLERVTGYSPARSVPTNPTTIRPDGHPDTSNSLIALQREETTFISSTRSRRWAHLFNIRYRMLLTYLAHTYRLARAGSPDTPGVRAAVMHRAFGEMYNLKTIAGILVRLPLQDGDRPGHGAPRFAGPTFEMPYTVRLPFADTDCWRLHQDLLASAETLIAQLLRDSPPPDGERYLGVLRDLDAGSRQWVDAILAGIGSNGRATR